METMLSLATGVMWGAPALAAPALLLLEIERRWTRGRRARGLEASHAAYLLDALVLTISLLAVVGTVWFAVGITTLALMRAGDLAAQALASLRQDPLTLAGVLLVALATVVGVAVARGWVLLPQPKAPGRPQPAGADVPAKPEPAPSTTPAIAQPTPSVPAYITPEVEPVPAAATALESALLHDEAPAGTAPPAESATAAATSAAPAPAARRRPSPAVTRSKASPWAHLSLRAAPPVPDEPAPAAYPTLAMLDRRRTPAASERAPERPVVPTAPDPESEPVPTLAMLDNRRVARASASAERDAGWRAASSAPVPAADDQDPPLAMLNNRRRPMNQPGAAQPALSTPMFVPATPPAPAPNPQPHARGWWHVPLAATVLLVIGVAVGISLYRGQLVASLGELGIPVAVSDDQPTVAESGVAALAPELADSAVAPTAPATLEPLPAPTAPPVVSARVAADQLNVRASPGANQPIVVTLARGDEVQLLGEERSIRTSTWVKVRAGSAEGWVNRSYLE